MAWHIRGVTYGLSRTASASSSTSDAAFSDRKADNSSREKPWIRWRLLERRCMGRKNYCAVQEAHYNSLLPSRLGCGDGHRRGRPTPREGPVKDQTPPVIEHFLVPLAG